MEQLKVGDKVKILWEETYYLEKVSYQENGVIVGKETRYHGNGTPFEAYVVGGFDTSNEKNVLHFWNHELVKIPEITKKFEPMYKDMKKYALHIQGQWLGNIEETVLRYTLPTKVVFDINKRKTTLLFGDKPYEHKVSGIAHKSDTFDTASGFFIQLAKHILRDKWQDKMKMWDYLSNSDFNTVKMMIFNFVLTHLKEELGMSFRQLDKLSKWNFKAPLMFEIGGIKHTIEVEHKFDLKKNKEK